MANRAPPRSWFTYEAFNAAEQMFGRASRGTAPELSRVLAWSISSHDDVTRCATTTAR
jgi:hypothetical protein